MANGMRAGFAALADPTRRAVFERVAARPASVGELAQGLPVVSREYRIWRPEGDIAHDLRALAEANTDLTLGSYPSVQEGRPGTTIVVRGVDQDRVDAVAAELGGIFPAH